MVFNCIHWKINRAQGDGHGWSYSTSWLLIPASSHPLAVKCESVNCVSMRMIIELNIACMLIGNSHRIEYILLFCCCCSLLLLDCFSFSSSALLCQVWMYGLQDSPTKSEASGRYFYFLLNAHCALCMPFPSIFSLSASSS